MEPPAFSTLKKWLKENGGEFHENVEYQQTGIFWITANASIATDLHCLTPEASGHTAVAVEDIPANVPIVACPFSLVITGELAKRNLSKVLSTDDIVGWTEKQWMSVYICFHWILSDSKPAWLEHYPYINTLPSADQLRTSLHFTDLELEAFRGSHIYQATITRKNVWRVEWQECQFPITSQNLEWGKGLTWERYLTAATYISSRAFPSSLLSQNPTLESTPETQSVLLPGVDSLNHKRAQPVTWFVDFPTHSDDPTSALEIRQPTISIVLHTDTPAKSEIFNNYGRKPNAELVLGYGFSIPENPDDTILLMISGMDKKWEIGRRAQGADAIWQEVLSYVRQKPSEGEEPYEIQADAAALLAQMVKDLIENLPSEIKIRKKDLHSEVAKMWDDYIAGQNAILSSILDFCRLKEAEAVEIARGLGVVLVIKDDDDDEF